MPVYHTVVQLSHTESTHDTIGAAPDEAHERDARTAHLLRVGQLVEYCGLPIHDLHFLAGVLRLVGQAYARQRRGDA